MSSKRKFARAQATRGKPPSAGSVEKSRAELRRELADERFKKPGSDKLWIALLGWDSARLDRIWLVQALNDAVQRKLEASGAARELEARVPELAPRVSAADLDKALDLWRSSGDEYTPAEAAPKWHYLAALVGRLGLGEPSAEELQDDWEAWTALRLAAPLRNAMMTTLGQGEQAAVALQTMTRSENVAAIVNVMRCTWTALAYGDPRAFEKLRKLSDEWLAG